MWNVTTKIVTFIIGSLIFENKLIIKIMITIINSRTTNIKQETLFTDIFSNTYHASRTPCSDHE